MVIRCFSKHVAYFASILLTLALILQSFILMYLSTVLGGPVVLIPLMMALITATTLAFHAFFTEKSFASNETKWLVLGLITVMVLLTWVFQPQKELMRNIGLGLFALIYSWVILR